MIREVNQSVSLLSESQETHLEIHLGLVLSQTGHSGEQGLALHSALSEDEQKGSDEGEVAEEELEVPEDAVGNCLENHDEEEDPAGDVHLEPGEHHGHGAQLAHQVDDDEHGGQEPAAAPGDVHVLPLLAPLDPHTDAVLEECGDQAEPGEVGQDMLRMSGHLQTNNTLIINNLINILLNH